MTVQLKKKPIVLKVSKRCLLFQDEFQYITELLNQGTGLSLAEIRGMTNLKQG